VAQRGVAVTGTVYQLRVVLAGISQMVWRRLMVPAETSIAGPHEILQTASKTRHKSPRTVMRYISPATKSSPKSPACSARPGAPTEPGRQAIAPRVPGQLTRINATACT
jgi:hypothetical protein